MPIYNATHIIGGVFASAFRTCWALWEAWLLTAHVAAFGVTLSTPRDTWFRADT